MNVRTRFAPSPTGYVHVGNARTALFSALLAAKEGGRFVLRIEDTDAARSNREFEEALKTDLGWLGLRWQEGPDVGGDHGPYRQSERSAIYAGCIDQLSTRGLVYPCFCSAKELELARKTQLAAGKPPRYAGTCAKLGTVEIESRLARGLKPALRFRVPDSGETVFEDMVRGRQTFAHRDIGDFIIRRADGSPAFFFSNAIDDALMGITHVLRGEDHLANTPRQLLLLAALGLRAPVYGHLSLVVGSGGQPLSKRHGSASLRDLRRADLLPAAVVNYLARLGHSYPEADNHLMGLDELATRFDVSRIGHSPAHFDENHLHHWQKLAISAAGESELWEWMKGGKLGPDSRSVEHLVPADKRMLFVQAIRPNILMASQTKRDYQPGPSAWFWAMTLFGDADFMMEHGRAAMRLAGQDYFRSALGCIEQARDYKPYVKALAKETGKKGPDLYMPLRAALTGDTHGPELKAIWELLGTERIRARLAAAASLS